ncbi:MAG: PQQ-binding-like beta-propeller repeat protein [Marinilabiliaceae bacterium]|nr:PQQ-binding-like beta-propeller repeat protein [Marinilabiliaceae bacterium]
MKFIIIVVFLVVMNFMAGAQLKGYVFHDKNGNGARDIEEQGISDAVVSDGFHVIRTDKKGRFNLPGWEKQRFVTLYTGAGFSCMERYLPICEEGEYAFAVTPKKTKQQVSFVQISDTETFEHRDWLDQLKQYSQVHKPDFIVHTGDICYRSGMVWHSENVTEVQMGVPVYYCLGNHDLVKGDYGEQFFEQCFGPAWYAFEEGNTLYVVTPMMGGDYKPGFTRPEIGGWLKNLLNVYDRNQPKVFFNHDLLTDGDSFRFKIDGKESIVLEGFNLKAWLYGHWHENMVKKHGDSGVISYGTSTLVKGGIDHSPSGFRVINVDKEGNTDSHFRWTYLNRQIEIASPQKGKAILNSQGEIEISVNTYHSGAEVDSVKYGIWGESGFNWNSALEANRWKKMIKNSDWNWSASYKTNDQKQYELVVDAYLRSGEILHAKKKFAVHKEDIDEPVEGNWYNLAGNMAHDPLVKKDHKLPYQLIWSANVGSNIFMSSPVVHKNFVMTSSFDDGNAEKCHIVCWDAATGKEQWKYNTLNGVKNQMVIAEGLVIATDMQGMTYAIDIETGKLHWKRDLQLNRLPGFVTGIVTDGKVVYTGFGKSLCALNAATGEIIWKNEAWNGGEGTTPTMTIADDVLVVSKHWSAIFAHDTKTGKLLWSRGDDGLRFRDGVVGYRDGSLWLAERKTFEKGKVHQLELKTGKTIRSFLTGMQNTGTSAPVVLEELIIVAGSHPGVAAFDRASGEKKWQFEVDAAMIYTPSYFCDREQSLESTPVVVGDKIVFGAMDGNIYVLDIDTGKLLWKTKLGAPVLTTVAVTEECFYICDFAGNIYCFSESKF